MPPNRQSVASVLRTLSAGDLTEFVTESKYAPLTAEAESDAAPAPSKPAAVERQRAEEHVEELAQEEDEQAVENYWDEAEEEEEQATEEEPIEEEPIREEPVEPSESYWGWPSLSARQDSELDAVEAEDAARQEAEEWEAELARREAALASVLAEEAARAAVSTANIERNLIADAAARAEAKDAAENAAEPVEVIRNTDIQEEEGYWDWDAETDTQDEAASPFAAAHIEELLKKEAIRIKIHSHSPQNSSSEAKESYWEWDTPTPDQEKRRTIEKILEDERARRLLTSSRIQDNLENASGPSEMEVVRNKEKSDGYWDWDAEEQVKAPHTRDPTHPSNSYWDWTPPVTQEDSRNAVIQRILADEAARQALSVSHIQDNLKNASGPSVDVLRNEEKKDDYWDWNLNETGRVRAPHTRDPMHPSNSYWDWAPSVSPEDSRDAVIRRILADEASRRALSVSHTEETLKGETWAKSKDEVDRWFNRTEEEVVRNEATEEVGYWDM